MPRGSCLAVIGSIAARRRLRPNFLRTERARLVGRTIRVIPHAAAVPAGLPVHLVLSGAKTDAAVDHHAATVTGGAIILPRLRTRGADACDQRHRGRRDDHELIHMVVAPLFSSAALACVDLASPTDRSFVRCEGTMK